jgi:hypothetical protein
VDHLWRKPLADDAPEGYPSIAEIMKGGGCAPKDNMARILKSANPLDFASNWSTGPSVGARCGRHSAACRRRNREAHSRRGDWRHRHQPNSEVCKPEWGISRFLRLLRALERILRNGGVDWRFAAYIRGDIPDADYWGIDE